MSSENPIPLIGIEDVAEMVGLPSDGARAFLAERGERPIGTYRGRPLWDADTVHDLLEEPACAHG